MLFRCGAGRPAATAVRHLAARRAAAAPGEGASGHPYLTALRLIGREAGFTVPAPPPGPPAPEASTPEALAEAARVRARQVRLRGRWWTTDLGPLLAHRRPRPGERERRPVVLRWRRGGYRLIDPVDGTRTRCTRARAAALEATATTYTPALPPDPVGVTRLLRLAARGARGDLVALLLGVLVLALLGLLTPIVTGRVLGVLVPAGRADLVVRLGVALIAAAVAAAGLQLVQNLTALRLAGRLESRLQSAVWDRLLRLPVRFFAGRRSGELADAALGMAAAGEILAGAVVLAAQSLLVGAVHGALMLRCDPRLGLLGLGLAAAVVAVCLPPAVVQMRRRRALWKVSVTLSDLLTRLLAGLPKLRVAAAEEFAFRHWSERFAHARRLTLTVRRWQYALTVLNAGLTPLCVLVVFAAVTRPGGPPVGADDLLAFHVSFGVLLGCAYQLVGAVSAALATVPLFEEVRPVLAQPPEQDGRRADPGTLTGRLACRRVSFGYPGGPPVLDGVDFDLAPGESLAVVGATGCGKSTLLRLLLGFEAPASGTVEYDGKSLTEIDPSAVRRQCGVVLQDSRIFAGTILSNICGDTGATVDDAWAAARTAALDRDLAELPMGLDTVLQDGGASLSAGQRQRLLIARAVAGRPRLLLLDEATSALDNATQAVVAGNLDRLGVTRVLIAHRLSTVLGADRVLVLDGGRVVQSGRPAELLADEHGPFRRLAHRRP
ncbi:ATP-binding cassette domain-containing protein [Kitasatospora sp. NPDC004240]